MAAGLVALDALGGLIGLGQAYSQAQALKQQAAYQKQMYSMNSELAGMQAQDAVRRGDLEAGAIEGRARQVEGSERASLAAQGIDPNSGSAAAAVGDTEGRAQLDMMTAKNNAWREAWGYKVQALDYSSRGEMAELSGNNAARNTLITGGLGFLNSMGQGYKDYQSFGGGGGSGPSGGPDMSAYSYQRSVGGRRGMV